MEYTILESSSRQGLKSLVKDYIADGWVPQGGVTLAIDYYRATTYCQAMIMGEKQ